MKYADRKVIPATHPGHGDIQDWWHDCPAGDTRLTRNRFILTRQAEPISIKKLVRIWT